MPIDTRRGRLDALRATGAPATAVDIAARLLDTRERISGARYNPERTREELRAADEEAAINLRVVLAEAEASEDRATARELREHDAARAAAATERRELRDTIDVERLREADDPTELLGLVRDADAAGEIVGAEARRIAEQRIRQEAAREQSRHIVNGRWFKALCALRVSPRGSARSDIEQAGERRKREARALVVQVADVVGLGAALQAALRMPPAPQDAPKPAKSTMVFGYFWEQRTAARR